MAGEVRRVVLGARVSTDDKNQDPTNQLLPLRAAMQRLGWEVVDTVIKEGLSGWNPKTALEVKRAFLAPIIAGRADTLAVWKLDRVTRGGIRSTLAFVQELEEHLGAHLFSLQEPWASTATQDKRTRELIMSIAAWVAEDESNTKSQRVLAKVHAKRNRANSIGQNAKWGEGTLATPEQIERIRALSKPDELGRKTSLREIAASVGVSKSQVHRILKSG